MGVFANEERHEEGSLMVGRCSAGSSWEYLVRPFCRFVAPRIGRSTTDAVA